MRLVGALKSVQSQKTKALAAPMAFQNSFPTSRLPGGYSSPSPAGLTDITEGSENTSQGPFAPRASTSGQPGSCDSSPTNHTVSAFLQQNGRPLLSKASTDSALPDALNYRKSRGWMHNDQRKGKRASRPTRGPAGGRRAVSNPETIRSRDQPQSTAHNSRAEEPQIPTFTFSNQTEDPFQEDLNMDDDDADPISPQCPPLEVHEKLRTYLREKINPDKKKGIVYIMRDKSQNRFKIGSTDNAIRRGSEHERDCGVHLELIHTSAECYNRRKAEFLAHYDLTNSLQPWFCELHKKPHREYFTCSKKMAIETVERWVAFINNEPYDDRGELSTVWDHFISLRLLEFPKDAVFDHDKRWRHWESIVTPISMLDYAKYVLHVVRIRFWIVWGFLLQHTWQVSLVSTWFGITMFFHNRYVSFATAMVFFCFVQSVLATKSIPPRKTPKKDSTAK